MRFELAPQGIDVVLIKPGPIRTPIWDRMGSQHEALARVLTTPDMQQVYGEDFVAVSGMEWECSAVLCGAAHHSRQLSKHCTPG